ncbi:MAG: DoxX family protein [Thermoguttaceae bacterium]|jgi:putative oxidoreductase
MKWLFDTRAGGAGLILRLGLGIVMFPHGMGKLLGWFGGPGFAASYQMFTQNMHIPAVLAVLVILAESLGAVGLIVGCLTRIAAFGLACDMIGAIAMVHWHNGFYMNWFGQQAGEGYEYHLLAIAIGLALTIAGAGCCSIDRLIAWLFFRKGESGIE